MNKSNNLQESLNKVDAANRKRVSDVEKRKYEKELELKIEANSIGKKTTNIAFVALIVSALSFVVSLLAYYKR